MKSIASWIREVDAKHFQEVFANYPDLRVYDARIEPVPWNEMDGLMLTGGADISEKFLRQPVPDPKLIEDPDLDRDIWEFDAVQKALKQRMPILAICRGHQILNVALGGTLHLDIPHHDDHKYDNAQELRYVDGVTIQIPRVNSSHHQSIDQLGAGLQVEARYQVDDTIEQVRLSDYPFCLGVQYHPERDPVYLPIFNAFAQQVRQGAS